MSSNARARTEVPSGDTTRIHAVINKELDFNLMAVFDEIMLVSELLFGSLAEFPCFSKCNQVWCGLWHFLHLCGDLQSQMKWPLHKQFIQMLFTLINERFSSWESALNTGQA